MALGGVYFGLAGLFQLSRLRQGDPTVAVGLELDIIAAVIIGGASLSGGVGGVLGSMIGALIMSVLRNGSQQMGWPTYFQEIIIGLVIILAVLLDRFRRQSRSSQLEGFPIRDHLRPIGGQDPPAASVLQDHISIRSTECSRGRGPGLRPHFGRHSFRYHLPGGPDFGAGGRSLA